MVSLVYDNSWTGFFTSVFEVYDRKLTEVKITAEKFREDELFAEQIIVISDDQKASRVLDGLKKKLSDHAFHNLHACFLSEIRGIEDTLLAFIRLAFTLENAEKAFANPSVLKVSQVAKMVYRERHRMEAFVRFKQTRDNIYFSGIEPDFNVLPLLVNHFKNRFADQKWLIYDLKRNYGIYYSLIAVEEVVMEIDYRKLSHKSEWVFKEEEGRYQTLWKDYFKSTTITERKNTRLHLKHVPRRYWKFLTEKDVTL